MTDYTARLIAVVTADLLSAANAYALTIDPVGGDKAFTQGLSAGGVDPPTHYWCNWSMRPTDRNAFVALLLSLPLAGIKVTLFDLDDPDPKQGRPTRESVLATMGVQVIAAISIQG